MPDPHRNCFYYYRGPSPQHDEEGRQRQVEDNTTKALINVLEWSDRQLVLDFVKRFVGSGASGRASFYLQGVPATSNAPERHLLAISRLTDLPAIEDDTGQVASRPDAAIYLAGEVLVVIEVKVDLALDPAQLRRHAEASGIDFPTGVITASWREVYDWASERASCAAESVTAFLLRQFVEYLEIIRLSPFAGMTTADFDFFINPTLDRQQQVKARLEALWQAVAEGLREEQRTVLGEVHVGALAFNDPNAWAQTNWKEHKVNLTIEMGAEELWFNIVGWQDTRARDLLRWLVNSSAGKHLRSLPGYELVAYRRRAGNWDNRATSGRPWWQRETFDLQLRIPAAELAGRMSEIQSWVKGLEEPWEKPGFHLRKTWTRDEAVAAGRDLVGEICDEVNRTVPILASIWSPAN